MDYRRRRKQEIALEVWTAGCDPDAPIEVEDVPDGEMESILEETVGSVEQELASVKEDMLIVKTQLFGANGEGGFCKQMQDSSQAQADALIKIQTDLETNQSILRSEMNRINEKQDMELDAFRLLITDVEVRLSTLEKAMDDHKIEHKEESKEKKAMKVQWYHIAIGIAGVVLLAIEVASLFI